MKKTVGLIIMLAAIVVLGWYAINLISNSGQSDPKSELFDFAIPDIETIDKVIITDGFNRVFEIHKQEDKWTDKDGNCIVQESVEFILEAFKNIEFKGYLPDNAHERFTNMMSVSHTKVEIFQNGEWTKTWFIGPTSQDHYGQVMLLESKESGKSDLPVLMKIKGMHGIIEPRFFADPLKWGCTNIFAIPLSDISKVEVKFNDEPQRSFSVTKNGSELHVYQGNKELSEVDTAMIFRYLQQYKKVHYDVANYVLNEKQVDSIKGTTPFVELNVTEKSGKSKLLKCYRIITKAPEQAGMTDVEDIDRNRFWCELPSGELVKCQYFVFNKLIFGDLFFPLDLSGVETIDGVRPIDE